jgi:hypothetical protein
MVDEDIIDELATLDKSINVDAYVRIRVAKIIADAIIRNGYDRRPGAGGGTPGFSYPPNFNIPYNTSGGAGTTESIN